MPDDTDDNVRMTMTISHETQVWLLDQYPDALELTEAVRMALSDARQSHRMRDRIESAEWSDS
jgi:hypothetical protein